MEPIKKILRTPSAFVLLLVAIVSLIGVILKGQTDQAIARLPIDATSTAEARLTEIANASLPQSTPVSFHCKPLLLSENFDGDFSQYSYYTSKKPIEVSNGKLRFTIDKLFVYGDTIKLFGQYEVFSVEFEAYPVGEIFDASVNVLFLQHGGGGYEYQIRPRLHTFQYLRIVHLNGQNDVVSGQGWTENSNIDFGEKSMLVRVNVQVGEFSLYINNNLVATMTDPDPYFRGEVRVGVGAGDVSPITMDIDNIRICGN
jgi:hypothetical protein